MEFLSHKEINQLFKEAKIDKAEMNVLYALAKENDNETKIIFLKQLLRGESAYKLNYPNDVSTEYYFTNVPFMLSGFYKIYSKFPEYGIDKLLYNLFNDLSKSKWDVYKFLTVFNTQLINEKSGYSPFKICNIEMLNNCKVNLIKQKEVLSQSKVLEGSSKPNGLMDVINEYNNNFQSYMGYNILDESGSKIL